MAVSRRHASSSSAFLLSHPTQAWTSTPLFALKQTPQVKNFATRQQKASFSTSLKSTIEEEVTVVDSADATAEQSVTESKTIAEGKAVSSFPGGLSAVRIMEGDVVEFNSVQLEGLRLF